MNADAVTIDVHNPYTPLVLLFACVFLLAARNVNAAVQVTAVLVVLMLTLLGECLGGGMAALMSFYWSAGVLTLAMIALGRGDE